MNELRFFVGIFDADTLHLRHNPPESRGPQHVYSSIFGTWLALYGKARNEGSRWSYKETGCIIRSKCWRVTFTAGLI